MAASGTGILMLEIILLAMAVVNIQCANEAGLPLSAENCPVVAKAACSGPDNTTNCECDGLAVTGSGGEYSCSGQPLTCKFCSKKYKRCIVDGSKFPCCTANPKLLCAKSTLNGGAFACIPACNSRNKFETCKDSKGKNFTSLYKSCKGKKPNTFTECREKDDKVKPTECGATDFPCDYFANEDPCCEKFRCDEKAKSCQPECPPDQPDCETRASGQSRYGSNPKKRCDYDRKFFNCTLGGRKFGSPARYLACNVKNPDTKNKWFECPGIGNTRPPRECGVTGAACTRDEQADYVDTCCTNFACVNGKCKPECEAGDKNCVVNEAKSACATANSVKFVPCTLNGRTYNGRYLRCKGSNASTWVECSYAFDSPSKKPRDCLVAGVKCDFLSKTKSCCYNFKCGVRSGKCEPECPKDKTDCVPSKDEKVCSNNNPFKNCTINGKVYSARYLSCEGPDPKNTTVIVECQFKQDYEPVRLCGIGESKDCRPRVGTRFPGSCCTNFNCDDKNSTCIPETPSKA